MTPLTRQESIAPGTGVGAVHVAVTDGARATRPAARAVISSSAPSRPNPVTRSKAPAYPRMAGALGEAAERGWENRWQWNAARVP